MNGKFLLEKMDLVDPKYIEEAEKRPRKKPMMLPQWIGLAACFVICCISGLVLILYPESGTNMVISGEDTASLFGSGGIALAVLLLSLLAAVGIIAYIIKKRK